MRIAVTGGSGFVGQHLLKRLLKDNHEITVLSHRKNNPGTFEGNVHVVSGSVDSPEEMVPAFQGSTAVYHLVGIIAETKTNDFEKTVAQGTRNVVVACQEAQVEKIIFLSALGTSEQATTAYHRTKFEAEQAVIGSGLEWVILRASIIYGKGDGFLTLMSKIIKWSPLTPIFGDGVYKMQPVYIDDLTEAMTKALDLPQASRQIIDIGGPEQLEYEEIINHIKQALKLRRLNFNIPFAVIRPVATVLESLLTPAPLTRDQLTMLRMGNTGDITKMKELFRIQPVRFEDGLKMVIGDKING